MSEFIIAEGSPGLRLDEVVHTMVPGRERSSSPDGLSQPGHDRLVHGVEFYQFQRQRLAEKIGLFVCSGYKTPRDVSGELWTPEDSDEEFIGRPEADSMAKLAISLGLDPGAVRIERHSIDTVTNFARTEYEGHFGVGDERAVAIVAQAEHLDRILTDIAPKILRRDYLGVVVPEGDTPDKDGFVPRLASRAGLFGIDTSAPDAAEKIIKRSEQIWKVVNFIEGRGR